MSFKKSSSGNYYINCMGNGISVDDYYSSALGKEPPGEWYIAGKRSSDFGISDGKSFDAEDTVAFSALVRGFDPRDGSALTQNSGEGKRVGLYDFTFSAPKSVSVVWAIGSAENRRDIERAQRVAVRSALDLMSDKAGYTRTGKGGINKVHADLVGATFEHGSSRENDPQLHTHATILNIARRPDGTTGAIETKDMMSWQGASASMYHAVLASEMRKLGYELDTEKTIFEIKGVPQVVRDAFSTRRQKIEEAVLEKQRENGMRVGIEHASRDLLAQITIETRDEKGEKTRDELLKEWHVRAKDMDFGVGKVEALKKYKAIMLSEDRLKAMADTVPRAITENNSTFTEPTMYAAMAMRLQGNADAEEIRRQADTSLGSLRVLSDLKSPKTIYSTDEMIRVEQDMTRLAEQHDSSHRLDAEQLNKAFAARETLTQEQRDAITHIALADKRVSVLQGAAGAGKTFTLKTVCDLYRMQGYQLHAVAQTWEAASKLREEAELDSHRALTGWLKDVEQGTLKLSSKSVVVLDEASLVGSRQMRATLMAVEKARAKLILSGDEKQLRSISAGDALRNITERLGSTRLDVIRRQHTPEQRQAVTDFFDGRGQEGLNVYETAGDIELLDDAEQVAVRMVADWHADSRAQPEKSRLMLASERATVARLNREAHELRDQAGELQGQVLRIEGMESESESDLQEFREGDLVAFRTNQADLAIYNRTRGVISKIDLEHHRLEVTTEHGDVVVDLRDERWFDMKHRGVLGIQHGYAMTVSSSQGQTVDRVYAADSLLLNRRSAGVMMSRHREACRVYVDAEARHESAMNKLTTDEWRPRDSMTREELLEDMADGWSRSSNALTTLDFDGTLRGRGGPLHAVIAEKALLTQAAAQLRRKAEMGMQAAIRKAMEQRGETALRSSSSTPAPKASGMHAAIERVLQQQQAQRLEAARGQVETTREAQHRHVAELRNLEQVEASRAQVDLERDAPGRDSGEGEDRARQATEEAARQAAAEAARRAAEEAARARELER